MNNKVIHEDTVEAAQSKLAAGQISIGSIGRASIRGD